VSSLKENPSLPKDKKTGFSLAGSLSLFIHLAIFILIGGTVIIEQVIPKQAMTGEVVVNESVVDSPPEEMPEDTPQDVPQPTDETQTQSAPSDASPFDVNTVVMDSPTPNFSVALGTTAGTPGIPGTGTGGTGSGPVGGSKKKVSFIGIESEAESVGFYLDFSGSMEGERKKKLIQELDKTLRNLPDGMKVMIINWAGPAWGLDEQASEVMKFWKKNAPLNWSLEAPSKVTPPKFFILDSNVRRRILNLIEKTVQAPGGTDWRSPFILASKGDGSPDVIYFMTDGQLEPNQSNKGDVLQGISKAIKASSSADATVNVVGLSPKPDEGKVLKKLAEEHKGRYVEIK